MLAGLILAGGVARRLGGGNKPLRLLGDRPILSHVQERLAPQVARLAISANGDPARFARFGLKMLEDGAFAGQGPLAGLLAGLDWAAAEGAEELLCVPGDTPFIPPDLAARLSPAPACAASGGRAHWAVSCWGVALAHALRAYLRAPGRHAIAGFGAQIGLVQQEFAATAEPDPFFNINTPDDLQRAQKWVA